ncbi:MAG: hypothetical protein DI537_62955 [Stutzerimonas stutzeri]|nr:MAG: hypothetical protein DI537_62955 [Stutzerimonas stutzeri]
MPRYHFYYCDSSRDLDTTGTELAGDQAAQHAAIAFAGEVLRFSPTTLWDRGHWRIEVTDAEGMLLFTILTLAINAPKPIRRKPVGAND